MSYLLSHLPVAWLVFGMLLIIAELTIPGGFVLLLLGMGALTVSLISWIVPMNLLFQLFLFGIASLMYTFLLKENLKAIFNRRKGEADPENEFKGGKGIALTPINKEAGKVEYKGTQWPAKSESDVPAGDEVEILDLDSITLIVKSSKK